MRKFCIVLGGKDIKTQSPAQLHTKEFTPRSKKIIYRTNLENVLQNIRQQHTLNNNHNKAKNTTMLPHNLQK